MCKYHRKVPSVRETRKKKAVPPPFPLIQEIVYFTKEYLNSIGINTANLPDPVPIKYVEEGFIIIKNYGKED